MAWIAKLMSTRKRDDAKWEYVIGYTNGVRRTAREYTVQFLDDATVLQTARQEVARLEALEAAKGAFTLADNATLDLTPPTPPAPTAAELARQNWFDRYYKLKAETTLVSLGLLAAVTVDVPRLKTDMLPAYMDRIT